MLKFIGTAFGLIVALILLLSFWPHATHPIMAVTAGIVAAGAFQVLKARATRK